MLHLFCMFVCCYCCSSGNTVFGQNVNTCVKKRVFYESLYKTTIHTMIFLNREMEKYILWLISVIALSVQMCNVFKVFQTMRLLLVGKESSKIYYYSEFYILAILNYCVYHYLILRYSLCWKFLPSPPD